MLNRRHLRIKVLQLLYAYYQNGSKDYSKVAKELTLSLDRMYDMYLLLLMSFEPIVRAAEYKIEDGKKKLRPTEKELNPSMKFVENPVFRQIISSRSLANVARQRKIDWLGVENQEMFKRLFNAARDSEVYALYMANSASEYELDRQFAVQFFKELIANNSQVYHFFEERSIYWMDDLDLCCSMVIKTIKALQAEEDLVPMPLFKEGDDEQEFVDLLLRKTIDNDAEYEALIAETSANWESDRIAKMDMVMLKMGISELLWCPSIPSKVTLNEYIEISKFYSTPKSNVFINGILDNIVLKLKSEGRFRKIGRGLLE
jgi:N utilization substance protein B